MTPAPDDEPTIDDHAAEPQAPASVVRLPIHSDLVGRLRDAIIEGEFAEGSRLSERVLCELLDVSRSPLREALKAIAAEGLIELLPNRGARIVKLSIEQLRDTFNVVAILEMNAAAIACEVASAAQIAEVGELHFRMARFHALGHHREFFKTNMMIHEKIVEAAGNPVLLEVYRTVNSRIRRFRFFSHQAPDAEGRGYRVLEQSYHKAMGQHEQIFEAFRARDAAAIRTLIERHYAMDGSLERLRRARAAQSEHDDADWDADGAAQTD
jgi:DNA-binding GntR family transcriptional regulator